MSVWYNVEGFISINKSAHCSLKKILDSFEMECSPSVTLNPGKLSKDKFLYFVRWCNSLDGKEAYKEIDKIVKRIKEFDKDADIDLNCEIRILM